MQVSDWWEEYVYLSGRSPIMINSNYYGLVDALPRFHLAQTHTHTQTCTHNLKGACTLVRINLDAFVRRHSCKLSNDSYTNAYVLTVKDMFCYGRPM